MAEKKLQVLNALDVAKTQWHHFTAIIIAGMGFFTDAYDLFSISLVTKLLGRIYYHVEGAAKPGTLPPNVSAAVNGVAFCGTLAGQIFFGWLGDKLGRKKVYGMTLMMMVICSIASGISFGHTPKSVMATLCFCRFWLGFGIGGDFPLSATTMSEYANKKTRGAFIAAVFAMQGFGILAGGIFAIVISSAFKARFDAPAYEVDPSGSTVPQADYVWRIILMVGSLPALLTYYWRMKMPETARYTALVAKNAKQAASNMSKVLQMNIEAEPQKVEKISQSKAKFGLLSKGFLQRHGLRLLGTTTTWFFLNLAFYSQNLFQKDIFSAIGWIPAAKTMNAIEEVFRFAKAQTLLALCSTVPGYWFTFFFIDKMGRFAIQLMGFFFMTVFMFGLTIPYDHWTHKDDGIGFMAMYLLTFFFANFGTNATSFVVPSSAISPLLGVTASQFHHGLPSPLCDLSTACRQRLVISPSSTTERKSMAKLSKSSAALLVALLALSSTLSAEARVSHFFTINGICRRRQSILAETLIPYQQRAGHRRILKANPPSYGSSPSPPMYQSPHYCNQSLLGYPMGCPPPPPPGEYVHPHSLSPSNSKSNKIVIVIIAVLCTLLVQY